MRQAINGAILRMTEGQMRKERWSTNFGWATESLRQNKGQTELYECPSDPDPHPIPALQVRLYDGGTYKGTTTSDAIFNHVWRTTDGGWQNDIQDSVEGSVFGGDAMSGSDVDLLVEYKVNPGDKAASIKVAEKGAGWRFDVLTYSGKTLWPDANTG